MIIEKTFETKLTFKSTQDIYNPNLSKLCLDRLNQIYKGKCYKASFILKVTRVITHSLRTLNDVPDGSVNVSIMFAADCIIYLSGEIVTKCKITQIEPNNKIYAENEYASILIDCNDSDIPAQKTAFYAVNLVVPVICFECKYITNRDKISMIAYPLVKCQRSIEILSQFMLIPPIDTCFKIEQKNNNPLSESTRNKLIDDIEQQQKALDKLPRDVINYFKRMFEVTIDAELKSVEKRIGGEVIKLTDRSLPNVTDNMHICKEFRLGNIMDDSLTLLSDSQILKDVRIIVNDLESAVIVLLNKYLHNCSILIELASAYPSMQAVRSSERIWKAFVGME